MPEYGSSAPCAALSRGLIREVLAELVWQALNRECSLYLACGNRDAFFSPGWPGRYRLWSCHRVRDALRCLLDNVFVRFGSGLCGLIVGVPVGAGCAPLVADMFLFCFGGLHAVSVRQWLD